MPGAERIVKLATDPDPYEGYKLSQGLRVGEMVYVSGTVSISRRGEVLHPGDFEAQTHQVFRNIGDVLELGGATYAGLVRLTVYLTDIASQFETFIAVKSEYLRPPYPVDAVVGVAALGRPEILIEVDATAVAERPPAEGVAPEE